MRLKIILPRINPTKLTLPAQCPHSDCGSTQVQRFQVVKKSIRDTVEHEVEAWRCVCLRCGRTFRVYPEGVDRAQASLRVRGLGVMLYLLGLSYGATSLVLEALGVYRSKSQVYDAVQAAARRVPGLRREAVFEGIQTPAVGADVTSVKCKGQWVLLGLAVNDIDGTALSLDVLAGEDAESLKEWLAPVLEATGAQLLVTDDADSFKQVADAHAVQHQICKSHVQRNTEALVEELKNQSQHSQDGSLSEIGVTPEEAREHLETLLELVSNRDPQDEDEVAKLYDRYVGTSPPKKGERASLAYRLYLLFLDRYNLWRRLTCYRHWEGPNGERVDGTNNGCERAFGWWIKERYRTMRGYKVRENALYVSRLLVWCGNQSRSSGASLSQLLT
jgi:transposase-like protein